MSFGHSPFLKFTKRSTLLSELEAGFSSSTLRGRRAPGPLVVNIPVTMRGV